LSKSDMNSFFVRKGIVPQIPGVWMMDLSNSEKLRARDPRAWTFLRNRRHGFDLQIGKWAGSLSSHA